MKISELILLLNDLQKSYGDLNVIGVAPCYETYNVEKENVSFLEKDEYISETAIFIVPN